MPRQKTIPGMRRGMVTVLEPLSKRFHTRIVWKCRCDCGNECLINGDKLCKTQNPNCGCFYKERARLALLRKVYLAVRKSAKIRNIHFDVTFESFLDLVDKECHYCNEIPAIFQRREHTKQIKTDGTIKKYIKLKIGYRNGIDRLDSTKGYVSGNMVPCCPQCNYSKRTMNLEEFKSWIAKVHSNLLVNGHYQVK